VKSAFFEVIRPFTQPIDLYTEHVSTFQENFVMRKLFIGFATFALAIGMAASTYRVNLLQPSVIAGQELKPGEYKIELRDNKAIVSSGKATVESDVKVETNDTKFSTTSVRYTNGDGKYKVQEIRLGGTTTRLVFNN